MKKKTCRAHCRACGAHFSSVLAFDLHRIGTDKEGRECWAEKSPEDLKLREVPGQPVCQIGYGEDREPITLYEASEGADRLKDHYQSSKSLRSSPLSSGDGSGGYVNVRLNR